MSDYITLTCKAIMYYSMYDEDAFFEWIKKIKAIKKIDGAGDELYLYVDKDADNKDIGELLALFERYFVDLKQLKVFINESNRDWLIWKELKIV